MNHKNKDNDIPAADMESLFASFLRAAAAAPRHEITRRVDDGPSPLSSVQEGFWINYQLKPDDIAYNVTKAFLLRGALDREALEESINIIVRRQEVLRTRFFVQDGRPVQEVLPAKRISLPAIDLRMTAGRALSAESEVVRDYILAQSQIPFNLTEGAAFRFSLLKLDEAEHLLLLIIHHIIEDASSIQVFLEDLADLYESIVEGSPTSLPDLPVQYADYAVWQQNWLLGDALQRQAAYWENQLADFPPTSTFPPEFQRPAVQTANGGREFLVLDEDLSRSMADFCAQEGVTSYMVFLTVIYVLLYRCSGQTDLLVGTPVVGRNQAEIRRIMGCFLNTLVIRADLSADLTFHELLHKVRHTVLDGYSNQNLPFDKLVQILKPARTSSYSPLFQVMYNHEGFSWKPRSAAGLQITEVAVDRRGSLFDMFIETVDNGEEVLCVFSYDRSLYRPSTIKALARHFVRLLHEVTVAPDRSINDLQFLTEEDYHALDSWNQTESDYSYLRDLATQFSDAVRKFRDAPAYIAEERMLTFGELDELSNQLAHFLISKGIHPGMRVGLALERSLDSPVFILAIIKAGAVYVPLDPSYPRKRLRYMAHDCAARVILTSTQWKNIFEQAEMGAEQQVICLDQVTAELNEQPVHHVEVPITLDSPLFVIYTSGSLGKPKGIEHRQSNFFNRIGWFWEAYPFRSGDVGCQKTALNFIDSIIEFFSFLLKGLPTVIIPDERVRDPKLLVETLAAENVTHLWLVPSLLRAILMSVGDLRIRLPRLNFWVASGEALPVELAQQFKMLMPGATLHNGYGTSEVFGVSWYDPNKSESEPTGATVPIGRPDGNIRFYVVDKAGNLLPIGMPGELWISGASVADGYIGRPDLTAERFVTNPFAGVAESNGSENPYARAYRSGDLVRWLPDGSIDYLGRVDRQVQVRGMRVELEEIESQLREFETVQDAVVIADGRLNKDRLLAFVVLTEITENMTAILHPYLQDWLPDYLIPSRIIPLDAFPLTPSGKVDRLALSKINLPALEIVSKEVEPRTKSEMALANLWLEVLGLESVGINTNFFEAGGHSLLAIRLFTIIEERLGVRLPLNLLYQAPTIAQMAVELENGGDANEDQVLIPVQPQGSRPPLFAPHGVFGDILAFHRIAMHLNPGQPFYGFQALGMLPGYEPDQSIEDIAARYVNLMRCVQPRGPYHLAGYCFGGVLAYEMACQIEDMGESVALLAIIEGSAPRDMHADVPLYDPRRLRTIGKALPYWVRGYQEFGGWRLPGRSRNNGDSDENTALRRRRRLLRDDESDNFTDIVSERSQIQYDIRALHRKIYRNYRPRKFGGRILLFRASAARIGRLLLRPFDPERGWSGLAAGGVEVRYQGGTHFTIVQGENAADLARQITDALPDSAANSR